MLYVIQYLCFSKIYLVENNYIILKKDHLGKKMLGPDPTE